MYILKTFKIVSINSDNNFFLLSIQFFFIKKVNDKSAIKWWIMVMLNDALLVPSLQLTSPVTSSLVCHLYDKVVTLVSSLDEFSWPTTEWSSIKLLCVLQEREQNWFLITDYCGEPICPLIEHRSYRIDRYIVNYWLLICYGRSN